MATLVLKKDKDKVIGVDITGDTESESHILASLQDPSFVFQCKLGSVAYNGQRTIRISVVEKLRVDSVFDVKAIQDEAESVTKLFSGMEGAITQLALSAILKRLNALCEKLEKQSATDLRKMVDEEVLQIPGYVKEIERLKGELKRAENEIAAKDNRCRELSDRNLAPNADGGNYANIATDGKFGMVQKWLTPEEHEIVEKLLRGTMEIHYDGRGFIKITPELFTKWGNCYSSEPRMTDTLVKLQNAERALQQLKTDHEKDTAALRARIHELTPQLCRQNLVGGRNINQIDVELQYEKCRYGGLEKQYDSLYEAYVKNMAALRVRIHELTTQLASIHPGHHTDMLNKYTAALVAKEDIEKKYKDLKDKLAALGAL